MTEMMECGHAANATSGGKPVCAICIGIDSRATKVVGEPDLGGRMARCSYARANTLTHRGGGQYSGTDFPSTRPSSTNLAFFAHKPDQAEDEFYCGCWGWD